MSSVIESIPVYVAKTLEHFDYCPDAYALRLIPESMAREHQWLPYQCQLDERILTIATARVPVKTHQRRVAEVVRQSESEGALWRVRWCLVDAAVLGDAIEQAYEVSYDLDDIGEHCTQLVERETAQFEDEWPMVRWFDALLNDAVHRRASDIHLASGEDGVHVHYRVDGILHRRTGLHLTLWRALLARIKVLSKLDVTEHRRPQDGALQRIIQTRKVSVRVAIMPHRRSEKATLRLLSAMDDIPSLERIFVLPDQLKTVQRVLHHADGLVLVAGATGSGKTTTLYGCLEQWRLKGMNLVTLEDPVEVPLSGVCQSEIRPDIGFTFSDGLRAALRHDPDGLLIGEIRDSETCALALRASITGHPVLSSVHANDPVGVIRRLMELGASVSDLEETVRLVLVQHLLKRPCQCLGDNKHCHQCRGSGYSDRVAAIEILEPDAAFFSQVTTWGAVRTRTNCQLVDSVKQLHQRGFIDQQECDQFVLTRGGKDAEILCTGGRSIGNPS